MNCLLIEGNVWVARIDRMRIFIGRLMLETQSFKQNPDKRYFNLFRGTVKWGNMRMWGNMRHTRFSCVQTALLLLWDMFSTNVAYHILERGGSRASVHIPYDGAIRETFFTKIVVARESLDEFAFLRS